MHIVNLDHISQRAAVPLLPAACCVFYSSSRNTRDFNHEIRAQRDIWLHREYNLAMKNKSLRRIAAAQRRRCFAPCAARQERRGVLEMCSALPVQGKEVRICNREQNQNCYSCDAHHATCCLRGGNCIYRVLYRPGAVHQCT